jgi:hypothetical protein
VLLHLARGSAVARAASSSACLKLHRYRQRRGKYTHGDVGLQILAVT